ncbi:MAG: N-acetylmuramoyl-L-alanine amidase [Planctomycetota bacterium]
MTRAVRTAGFGLLLLAFGCVGAPPRVASTAEVSVARGHQLLEQRQYDLALDAYRRAISEQPSARVSGDAWLGISYCEMARGRYQAAIDALKRAEPLLIRTPKQGEVAATLGECYFALDFFELAIKNLDTAVKYLGDGYRRRQAAHLLAVIHERAGSLKSAARYRAIAGPGDFPEYANLRRSTSSPATAAPTPRAPATKRPTPEVASPPREESSMPRSGLVFHPRKHWAANRTRSNVTPMGKVDSITIHHTGESPPPAQSTAAEVKDYLRRIQHHMQQNRQWADIGYHYLIDTRGEVWEGRDVRHQGAHAGSPELNAGNIGVALIGNFNLRRPSSSQLRALDLLVRNLCRQHRVRAKQVLGHGIARRSGGLDGTDCPGRFLEPEIAKLKRSLDQDSAPTARKGSNVR